MQPNEKTKPNEIKLNKNKTNKRQNPNETNRTNTK